MTFLLKTDAWIDQFQTQLSFPVAQYCAEFGRVPLIGTADLAKIQQPKFNVLTVVLGPFSICHDHNCTWWQPFWVVVVPAGAPSGNVVCSSLCRLNSSGSGGWYQVRLWDFHYHEYVYHGFHDRQIIPKGVATIICDYMSSQLHVGFVEDDKASAARTENKHVQQVYGNQSSSIQQSMEEVERQITYEEQAKKEHQ